MLGGTVTTTAPVSTGNGVVDEAVQAVTEQVARFKLIPQQLGNLDARVAQLQRAPAVTSNPAIVSVLANAMSQVQTAHAAFAVDNPQVDGALAEVQRIQAGGDIRFSTVGVLYGAAQAMRDGFGALTSARQAVEAVEMQVLTPEQRAAAAQLGTTPTSTMALGGLGGLGAVAVAAWLIFGKRGRR